MSKAKSPLLPIFLIVVVDILGLTIILPLLPFYAERMGATPKTVGLLVSVFAVCQLVAGPILGQLSDRYGRKPLLVISQIGTLIGFVILANAATLAMVFVSRVIDGLTAGNLSLAQAYISDVTEPRDRAKAFGVIGVAFGLGFLMGPAISGYLSQFGYHYPIYAAAGLSAASILATATLLPANPPVPGGLGEPEDGPAPPAGRRLALLDWGAYARYFRRPELGPLLWQFFCFVFFFALFNSGFALFAERRFTHDGAPFGPKQVGYVFAYGGFLGIFLQGGLIGRLVNRFGEARVIRAGFATSAAGYGLLGAAHGIPSLLAASTLGSVGHSALRPALTSLVTQRVGRAEQGVVLGLTQSLMSVAQIVAPVIAGFLIEHELLSAWAWLTAGVAALGLALARRETSASRVAVA